MQLKICAVLHVEHDIYESLVVFMQFLFKFKLCRYLGKILGSFFTLQSNFINFYIKIFEEIMPQIKFINEIPFGCCL